MTTDSDLVAAFLARKGVTKVETGARALDEKTMHDLAHGSDQKREAAKAIVTTPERDGEAEFEKAQQEAWLARYEGWKA